MSGERSVDRKYTSPVPFPLAPYPFSISTRHFHALIGPELIFHLHMEEEVKVERRYYAALSPSDLQRLMQMYHNVLACEGIDIFALLAEEAEKKRKEVEHTFEKIKEFIATLALLGWESYLLYTPHPIPMDEVPLPEDFPASFGALIKEVQLLYRLYLTTVDFLKLNFIKLPEFDSRAPRIDHLIRSDALEEMKKGVLFCFAYPLLCKERFAQVKIEPMWPVLVLRIYDDEGDELRDFYIAASTHLRHLFAFLHIYAVLKEKEGLNILKLLEEDMRSDDSPWIEECIDSLRRFQEAIEEMERIARKFDLI
ncbi:MAG: hypothetical protein QXZ31_05575 [Thermofilaceae archaeon]